MKTIVFQVALQIFFDDTPIQKADTVQQRRSCIDIVCAFPSITTAQTSIEATMFRAYSGDQVFYSLYVLSIAYEYIFVTW